jgi:hypothetical protein
MADVKGTVKEYILRSFFPERTPRSSPIRPR